MRNKRIKKILNKLFLTKEYLTNRKSIIKIAKETNIAKRTILDYLINFNIPRRKIGVPKGTKRSLTSRIKQSNTLKTKGHRAYLLWGKDKQNNNYKHGKYCNNKCRECGDKISPKAFRCVNCWSKNNKGKNNPNFGKLFKNSGWRGKGEYYKGIWLRSSYEVKYAKYLDKNNIKWQYEPKTFDLGNTTYTPDFHLLEKNTYIEIKGWFTDKAKNKIEIFKALYPNVDLIIFNKEKLKSLCVL